MKHARRAGRRDLIEPFVIGIARYKGWLVMQQDSFDLLCYRDGEYKIVECKTGDAKLTPHQEKMEKDGWPLVIVRSIEQAEEEFA